MRQEVTQEDIQKVMTNVRLMIAERIEKKGTGAFISRHEILGMLTEEYTETVEAVHLKSHPRIREELMDIVVGCIIGIISIDAGKMEY